MWPTDNGGSGANLKSIAPNCVRVKHSFVPTRAVGRGFVMATVGPTRRNRVVRAVGRPASAGRKPGTKSTTSSAVVRTGSMSRVARGTFASIKRSESLRLPRPPRGRMRSPGAARPQDERPGERVGVERAAGVFLPERSTAQAERRRRRRQGIGSGPGHAQRRPDGARARPARQDLHAPVRHLDDPPARDVDAARAALARAGARRPRRPGGRRRGSSPGVASAPRGARPGAPPRPAPPAPRARAGSPRRAAAASGAGRARGHSAGRRSRGPRRRADCAA